MRNKWFFKDSIIVRETMERDDHVHNPGITVNEYADCNLDPQNVHSDHAWAILWDGTLSVFDEKFHEKLNCCQREPIVRTTRK